MEGGRDGYPVLAMIWSARALLKSMPARWQDLGLSGESSVVGRRPPSATPSATPSCHGLSSLAKGDASTGIWDLWGISSTPYLRTARAPAFQTNVDAYFHA